MCFSCSQEGLKVIDTHLLSYKTLKKVLLYVLLVHMVVKGLFSDIYVSQHHSYRILADLALEFSSILLVPNENYILE